MNTSSKLRRAGTTTVTGALLALWGCSDAPTGKKADPVPLKPSFAAGGSISVNLDQCANNVPRGGNCTWQNGDINGSNSQYAEGLTVPFRLSIDGLTVGTAYTFHINYDWTAGGHKAYDFLAAPNATEQVDECSAGGGGVPLRCASLGTASTFVLPENSFPSNLSGGGTLSVTAAIAYAASAPGGGYVAANERFLKLYGGTITSVSDPTHLDNKGNALTAADLTGNTEADIIVTFTASQTSVLVLWSGHLAQSGYWDQPGAPNGAGQVSGAPWHMRTQQLQTASGTSAGNKNQDRSIQPSAILQPPVMTLQKTADAATVNAGDQIGYTITVQNTGSGVANNFSLTDPLPTGTGISWTIASQTGPVTCAISSNTLSCPPSGTATFPAGGTLTVHITSTTTASSCGTYSNTATVSLDNGVAPAPAGPVTITVNCPDVKVEKTGNGTVTAGQDITFAITVTSLGPGTAKSVQLTDALPTGFTWSQNPAVTGCSITSGTLTCNFGDLASGQTRTVNLKATSSGSTCGSFPNTANVSATNEPSSALGNNSSSATDIVNCADIGITKVADATSVSAGDAVGFTITVSNSGAGTATGVTLSDPLPAGLSWAESPDKSECSISSGTLSCNIGTLATGASFTVHVSATTAATNCGTLNNTATVTTTNDGSANASASVTVNCPDVKVEKTGNGTVNAGDQVSFTITVTSLGPGTAKGVTLTDNLPAGVSWAENPDNTSCTISSGVLSCNFGNMASGAVQTITVSGSSSGVCGSLPNTVSVSATNEPSNKLANNSASATDIVSCPDVKIEKTAGSATVNSGDQISFTITATNLGPGTANDVTVSDNLPAGLTWTENPDNAQCSITGNVLSCNFGSMAASTSKSVTITATAVAGVCGTVSNTATISASNEASGQTGNNSATANVTVACPDVKVQKTAVTGTVSAGETVSFTITATNLGPGTAKSVTVSDNLPSGLTWSENPDNPNCSITAGVLSCSFGDLAVNGTGSVTISATSAAANCGTVSNTATVSATNEASGVSANNTSTANVTVNCPSLTITKTPDKTGDTGYSVAPGGTATFAITVGNNGPGKAFNVVMTDTLPAGLTWSETKTECEIDQVTVNSVTRDRIICTIGTLNSGASFTVNVSATIPSDFLLQGPSPSGTALEIDGDLTDGAAAGKDWASIGINCTSTPKVGCDLDKPTGTGDDSFGQGTKEDTPVPSVVSGSIPNNKSDLLRFYVSNERFVNTDYLYLAWERVQAPNGTTNMDFELNQLSTISANNTTPVRKAGDILIKYDLAKGGTTPVLGFHRWVTAASAGGLSAAQACEAANAFPCWGKGQQITTDVAAAINTGSVDDPINPDATRSLDALTFGEASIDLQASGIFQAGVCVNFGQAYLKSRSSDSFSSEIKDFIAPIPVSVSNCQDKFLDNKAWAAGTGITAIADSGHIKVTNTSSASLFRTSELQSRALVSTDGGTATRAASADVQAIEATERVITSRVGTRRTVLWASARGARIDGRLGRPGDRGGAGGTATVT